MNRGTSRGNCLIYFIKRTDGLIKIGTTKNVERRLANISKSHGPLEVLKIINGDVKSERRIHNKFAGDRVFGEWFRQTPELLGWIDEAESGDAIYADAPEENVTWAHGEREMAEKVRAWAERIVQIRRQVFSASNQAEAVDYVCRAHGIRKWFLLSILSGRTQTVGAFGYFKIKDALKAELEAAVDEAARVLNDERDLAEIQVLAAKIKAKKGLKQ